MLQTINHFIENIVVSESFKALVSQIGTTQSDNQEIKELVVELMTRILEIQKKCSNLLNIQEVSPLQQAGLNDLENSDIIVFLEEPQHSDVQSSQQLINDEQANTIQNLQQSSNDMIQDLKEADQKLIDNQKLLIMKQEQWIYHLEQTILELNNKLNLLSAQSNEQKESYDIINKQENQQYVQQIVSSNQSVQMIEPLKQFKLIPNNDPLLNELQNFFSKIQEDSEFVWVRSKEALKLPFYYEKQQQESLLANLKKLQALSNDSIAKYGEWLGKSKEKNLNEKVEEQILVQIRKISIYNQKIMQTLSKLIEKIIKIIQEILEKYNMITEQHQKQQEGLKGVADAGGRLFTLSTKFQIQPFSTKFNLKEDKKIEFITANDQFIKEFGNLSIQFAIKQLNAVSQFIYREAKKICPVSQELRPEAFMSKIQSPFYTKASQLYQLGFDHMQKHKHLFSKQHSFLFKIIFEHYQLNMKHSLGYFQEQLNLLQKQQENLAKIFLNSKDEQKI